MAELTIDLTYAAALFGAASERGKKDEIMEDARQVLEIMKENPDLRAFINYPAISAAEKKTVLSNIFGEELCQEFLNFLFVLIDKGRTTHLEKILKAYENLMNQEEGFSYGTVYSVVPLKEERLKELEDDVSKLLQTNVRLTNETDSKLIGGIKILVEGKIIDASIRKKFDDLESQIILN